MAMASQGSPAEMDRTSASVRDLVRQCVSKFDECSSAEGAAGDEVGMQNRQADLRLWADGVSATDEGPASLEWRFRSRPDDLMLVKSILLMLSDFTDDYIRTLTSGGDTDSAIRDIDSAIENLALIGVAIRRTGKASRRRRVDMRFDPSEYRDFRQHLECMILLRPSKAGLPEKLEATHLSVIQQRLIHANLMRRHRFVIAQRRSRRAKSKSELEAEQSSFLASEASLGNTAMPLDPKTQGRKAQGKGEERQRQKHKEGVPKTIAGLTEASTAAGTLQYGPRRKYVAGAAKTQVTALAALVDFPKPPRRTEGRHIIKCPCCCQAFPAEEMAQPEKWRQHIVEDLLPYTCIADQCPTPNILFSTQKEWEAHVKADHAAEWRCPLCEDEDVVFDDKLQIIDHFEAEHSDDLESLTLATLLPWSEVQRTGIVACPLCSSYGLEDSPEIVSHVLKHVYEFSMRALPWTPPVLLDLNREIGRYILPEDEDAARRLEEWVEDAEAGTSTTLELPESAAGLEEDLVADDPVLATCYVPEDEYFDNESEAEASQRPEQAGTDSYDLDSRSSDTKSTQRSLRSGSVNGSAPVSEAGDPLAEPEASTAGFVYDGSEYSDDHQGSEASDAESSQGSKGIGAHVVAPDSERDNGSTVSRPVEQTPKKEEAASRNQSVEEEKHKGKDPATVLQEGPLVVEHNDQDSDTAVQTVQAVIPEPSEPSEPSEPGRPVEQESSSSESSMDKEAELFFRRQLELRRRRRRRMAMSDNIGKRTHSEVSDSNDSESDISDVNQVGSSASRMRRRWRRPAVLFGNQDPPEPTEELEHDRDEDGRPGDLAMELPYWNLEIMEVDE